jgi:hypothetical protein
MAQAFEVPIGVVGDRTMFSLGKHRTTPDTLPDRRSRPARPLIRIDSKNMGLAWVCRKRADLDQTQLATDPIPGSAIPKG